MSTKETDKTVSVIVCTYNGEQYLREQLDSILLQTYPIRELIIQDDGSTDGTVQIVKEYEARHPQVKVYLNEHNLGFNANFETAAMRATSDFIAIADQDDVWYPAKIEKQVAPSATRTSASAAITGAEAETRLSMSPRSTALKLFSSQALQGTPCFCAATSHSSMSTGQATYTTTGRWPSTHSWDRALSGLTNP